MKRFLLIIGVAILAIYVGGCLVLFFSQRSLIYFPTQATHDQPGSVSTLDVQDASLKISVRPRDGADALIYFGGNAEDVSQSISLFAEAFPKRSLYLLHYRGYGGSSGKPTEKALYSDAQTLYEMVHAKHSNVIIIGRSLGTAVAIHLASTNPASHLVLITPFDSILNLARKQLPWFPIGLLLQDKYESWRYAPLIKTPTMIIAAGNDEVVPRESTLALFNAFSPGIARMTFIPGAGHNTISESPDFVDALLKGAEQT
jgi:pimeloyl-ACP methyl ester carboxylesterase